MNHNRTDCEVPCNVFGNGLDCKHIVPQVDVIDYLLLQYTRSDIIISLSSRVEAAGEW
jgi:hypothetical protein